MNGSTKTINSIHSDREKTIAMVVYALQALSFLFVITFLVAVIINYVKRDDVRNSWLESHYRWQIRTFWFSLLWIAIGYLTTFILIGYLVLLVNMVWLIYRIIKGWLRLSEGREMYGISNPTT
ncbi:MAG: hypothetical protein KUF77_07445 [Candidatus Thiodiazotropha sp. (ex Lucina aurantia)]|nr:hypothetical protein [Candidatus Thiodiazotropha sp. (ex Lucina pensylvanica)]MBT3025362.1 hypothetical protein [Candidatus Thiodiazotropha taylori]MBT3049897.1 hypothetical protein [Candidatus Thiodiazotropha sp. (ex Codakia orbicularis)]MBV2102843.1 hypothetical protein [Candidatus Thiodiazotropha sp. (ex Lucina aurantia)]MBT3032275.1 hypothetical protein [Candidatus Thiodiazotropha sp. (ex Lucina pensylvanica)]